MLLMAIAFMYLAGRIPAMLGNHGTFDAWLHTLYFGMSLPGQMVRSGGPWGCWRAEQPEDRRGRRQQQRRRAPPAPPPRRGELGGLQRHRPGPEQPHAPQPGAVANEPHE